MRRLRMLIFAAFAFLIVVGAVATSQQTKKMPDICAVLFSQVTGDLRFLFGTCPDQNLDSLSVAGLHEFRAQIPFSCEWWRIDRREGFDEPAVVAQCPKLPTPQGRP